MFSQKTKFLQSNLFLNIGILFVILFFFLFISSQTGLLSSGFRYLIDDHQIPLVVNDLEQYGFWGTVVKWLHYENNSSFRFRPYYQFQIVLISKLFGLNAFAWFAYITLLGALTTFLFFLFARLLKFSLTISILFSCMIVVGTQSETWVRPMIPDSQGMFFLSSTLVFLTLSARYPDRGRINDILMILCAVLMSLCKESYILVIPTLILLKIYLSSYFQNNSYFNSAKKDILWLLGLIAIFVTEMIYILFFLGNTNNGYAGVDASTLNIQAFLETSWDLMLGGFFPVTLLSMLLLVIFSKLNQKRLRTTLFPLIPFILFFLTALLPHTILYTKSGITAGFYLFPFIVFGCLLLAKVLNQIEILCKPLALTIIIITTILITSNIPLVWGIYSQQAQDSRQMNGLFHAVAICAKSTEPILIVANPRVRYEALDSVQRVLRNLNKQNNLLIATYGLKGTDFYSEKQKQEEENWHFLDPKAVLAMYENKSIIDFVQKEEIQAVIIFDNLDNEFKQTNQSWFKSENFKKQTFPISFASANVYCKHTTR